MNESMAMFDDDAAKCNKRSMIAFDAEATNGPPKGRGKSAKSNVAETKGLDSSCKSLM